MRVIPLLLIALMLIFGCKTEETPVENEEFSITVKGSDTLAPLVNIWAEEFMKSNPDVKITVVKSDSETGINSLLNNTTDIAASSYKITKKQLFLAREEEMDIKEYVVAKDALVLIVNPKNSLKELSLNQIDKIFTGLYNNWAEVGGTDRTINVYSRNNSSGTSMFFQQSVMNKGKFTDKIIIMENSSDIIRAISDDIKGIGFIGWEYALLAEDKIKIMNIKNDGRSVIPDKESISKDCYPLSRPLYLYIDETEASEVIEDFIDYSISPEGQRIVEENNFIPVK